MSIGLPLIGAVPIGEALHCSDDRSLVVENIHSIRISDAITLRIFTSDDITLETGGSVWHAGEYSRLINRSYSVSLRDLKNIAILLPRTCSCGLSGPKPFFSPR